MRKRKRKKKKLRPIIRITSDHVELVSAVGVYGILLLEILWFGMTLWGVLGK